MCVWYDNDQDVTKNPSSPRLSIWLFDPNYRMLLYCCSLACQIGNIAVVAVIMCSLLCLCTGCSSKYSARSCGTMLALTVCTVAFDPCQNVKASVVLRYRFDSWLVTHLSAPVATAPPDSVLTWRRLRHRRLDITVTPRQHVLAAVTFSTIIHSLFKHNLPRSVCFISKKPAMLSPVSVEQQQQQQHRETRSHSLN